MKNQLKLLALWGMLWMPYSHLAQNVHLKDLRQKVEVAEDDSLKVEALNDLAFEYRNIDPDTTLYYALQALALSERIDFKKGIGTSLYNLGVGYHIRAEYDTALLLYDQSLIIANRVKDAKGKSRLINNIGLIHWNRGNYPIALEQFQLSLALDDSLGNLNGQASALNNMGLIYRAMGDQANALKFFRDSEDILTQLKDEFRLSQLLNNIGIIYADQHQHVEAIRYYRRSIWYSTSSGADCHRAFPLIGIAQVMYERGELDSTIHYSRRVLNIEKKCQQPKLNAQAHIAIGRAQLRKGNLRSAEESLLTGYQIADDLGTKQSIKLAANYLHQLYKKRGMYKQALIYHEIHSATNDSLFNESKVAEIARLESEYQIEKQKQQLLADQEKAELMLQQEIQKQKIIKNAGIAGFVLVLMLAVTYYRSYRRKKRANILLADKNQLITSQNENIRKQSSELKLINEKLTELSNFKEGLTQMIAHDMKNPLHVIISLANGKIDQDKLKIIGQSGREMLSLVTNMLDVQKFEETKMELDREKVSVTQLIDEARLQTDLLLISKSLKLTLEVEKNFIIEGDYKLLDRVLVNLITNAVKFSKVGGIINIKAEQTGENEVVISVIDNGVGISEEELPHVFDKFWQSHTHGSSQSASSGLGLTFCKLAVEAHNGTISAHSNLGEGTSLELSLPLYSVSGESSLLTSDHQANHKLKLTKEEVKTLQNFLPQLNDLKVHQVSKIKSVIKEIDELSEKSEWRSHLESAVLHGDQERFEELIELIR